MKRVSKLVKFAGAFAGGAWVVSQAGWGVWGVAVGIALATEVVAALVKA